MHFQYNAQYGSQYYNYLRNQNEGIYWAEREFLEIYRYKDLTACGNVNFLSPSSGKFYTSNIGTKGLINEIYCDMYCTELYW